MEQGVLEPCLESQRSASGKQLSLYFNLYFAKRYLGVCCTVVIMEGQISCKTGHYRHLCQPQQHEKSFACTTNSSLMQTNSLMCFPSNTFDAQWTPVTLKYDHRKSFSPNKIESLLTCRLGKMNRFHRPKCSAQIASGDTTGGLPSPAMLFIHVF